MTRAKEILKGGVAWLNGDTELEMPRSKELY